MCNRQRARSVLFIYSCLVSVLMFGRMCAMHSNASGVGTIIRYLLKCSFDSIWIDLSSVWGCFILWAHCCSRLFRFFIIFGLCIRYSSRAFCGLCAYIPIGAASNQGHSINIRIIIYFINISLFSSFTLVVDLSLFILFGFTCAVNMNGCDVFSCLTEIVWRLEI